MNIDLMVQNILEGKDITATLMNNISEETIKEDTQPAYYEVVYGYMMSIVKMDAPTTNYGAIVDIVIDNLEAEGADGVVIPLDQAEKEYNEDEYVVGGNHSMALITNGNFNISEISEEKANELNANDHVDIYCESYQIDEAAGRLVSVKIVDEPYGKGVEVKDSNGAIYRYAVDTNDPKYYTPEKVMHAVQGIARRNNYDMAKIYNFLKTHTLGDYDKDVSGRAGLGSAEIVAEPNGEGLKITLDNGKVFRYTVDTKDEKYDTLEKLKDGAEGMWRHGASVDGLISFLDNHAILYAREAMEMLKNRKLTEAADDKYELVNFQDGDAAMLFNNARFKDVPKGVFYCEIRGKDDDPGDFGSLEETVRVNFAGSLLVNKELILPIQLVEDDLEFTGETMTIDQFVEKYAK